MIAAADEMHRRLIRINQQTAKNLACSTKDNFRKVRRDLSISSDEEPLEDTDLMFKSILMKMNSEKGVKK